MASTYMSRSESSDEENPLHETESWFQTLKECLTRKRKEVLKRILIFDPLKNATHYDALDPSVKLKILNHLCDETLRTTISFISYT